MEQQTRLRDLRTAAIELGRQLRLFRRAVKRVLGASHPDHLRLRIRAKREADVEDDTDDLLEDAPNQRFPSLLGPSSRLTARGAAS